MNDDQLRIGDAEREQAAAELGEHYAQGRLAAEEHTERLDQIWAARTRSDLLPVFRDLPGPHRSVPSVPHSFERGYWSPGPWAGRRGVPGPLVVVLAVLLAITVVTHIPVVLVGLLVVVFVASRRRRHSRWSRLTPR